MKAYLKFAADFWMRAFLTMGDDVWGTEQAESEERLGGERCAGSAVVLVGVRRLGG